MIAENENENSVSTNEINNLDNSPAMNAEMNYQLYRKRMTNSELTPISTGRAISNIESYEKKWKNSF